MITKKNKRERKEKQVENFVRIGLAVHAVWFCRSPFL